jgi:hypothetical protein
VARSAETSPRALAENIDRGTRGTTIAASGGGVGGQILGMLLPLLANSASTPNIRSIIGRVAVAALPEPPSPPPLGAIKNRTTA